MKFSIKVKYDPWLCGVQPVRARERQIHHILTQTGAETLPRLMKTQNRNLQIRCEQYVSYMSTQSIAYGKGDP